MRLQVVLIFAAVGLASCCSWAGFADEPAARVAVSRGGDAEGIIEGEVVKVSRDGVSMKVQSEGAPARLFTIPWYEIRVSEGTWVVPDQFADFARKITIGHARRQRGDLQGCARIYSTAAAELLGADSELAREVFGGLLEESLVRGDFYDVMLAMTALESSGARLGTIDGFDSKYRVHEAAVMLPSPGLTDGSRAGYRLGELAGEMAGEEVEDGTTNALLQQAFQILNDEHSSGDEVIDLLGRLAEQRRVDVGARRGIELYSNMLSVQKHPDAEVREDARQWLMARSRASTGTWIEAWCRLGIGESFLNEGAGDDGGGEELVSRGIVELVHVIVRFGDDYPVLVRWARGRAASGLRSDGRFEEAAVLSGGFGQSMELSE